MEALVSRITLGWMRIVRMAEIVDHNTDVQMRSGEKVRRMTPKLTK